MELKGFQVCNFLHNLNHILLTFSLVTILGVVQLFVVFLVFFYLLVDFLVFLLFFLSHAADNQTITAVWNEI